MQSQGVSNLCTLFPWQHLKKLIENIILFLVHWLGHDKTLREQGVDDSSTVLLRQVKKERKLNLYLPTIINFLKRNENVKEETCK